MKIRSLAVLAIAAASLAPVGAHADFHDYDCRVAAGSATNPHISDPAGDYYSVLNGTSPPGPAANGAMGDVHGSGIDLVDSWMTATPGGPGGTTYRINMQVATLNELAPGRWQQAGTRFAFWWTHDVGPADRTERYVMASISQAGTVGYSHGYLSTDPTTGVNNINNLGSTTGSITAGTPGIVSIVIPFYNPSIGKPTVITAPFTRSSFDTVAFIWHVDEGKDNGPCFEITFA